MNYILLCVYFTNPTKSDVFVHYLSSWATTRGRLLSVEVSIKCLSQRYSHALHGRESNVLFAVLSRGADRSFMNDLRLDQCLDSSLHNTFCSPFTTKELTTAISKLSTSTVSGSGLIAYPLLTHLPPSAQQHLLFIFNWSCSSYTFPSCWKPATTIPIHKPGKPADSPASYPSNFSQFLYFQTLRAPGSQSPLLLPRVQKSNLSYSGRLST